MLGGIHLASFRVEGRPVAQGSVSTYGGHVVAVSPGLREWRETIKRAAAETEWGQGAPFDGPVVLEVHFYLPRPHRPKCNVPSSKPDGDKLLRAVQDALTATPERMSRSKKHPRLIPATPGLITDDARIIDGRYKKAYDADGFVGCWIFIRELYQR